MPRLEECQRPKESARVAAVPQRPIVHVWEASIRCRDAYCYCKACSKYKLENALALVVTSFRHVNGTKATFAAHNRSAEHRTTMERLMPEEKRGDILHQLSNQSHAAAKRGRSALLCILDVVRRSLRQNLPVGGHNHSEGTARQILELLKRHDDDVCWCLGRSHRTKLASADFLAEMVRPIIRP